MSDSEIIAIFLGAFLLVLMCSHRCSFNIVPATNYNFLGKKYLYERIVNDYSGLKQKAAGEIPARMVSTGIPSGEYLYTMPLCT